MGKEGIEGKEAKENALNVHSCQPFIGIISFNPHIQSLKSVLLVSFFIWENLLKIIVLISGSKHGI